MRFLALSPSKLRSAGILLGLLGGLAQLGVAFMGDAIGGLSAIVVVLALDAMVALAGAVVAFRWTLPGAALMAVAGVGAVVALFWSTWLEVGVAALLLGAGAATLRGRLLRG